jgi:hypothetical protein
MGIASIHGLGKAIASLPQAIKALNSSTPVEALANFAKNRGATFYPTSYVDDAGRKFTNYRPPFTSDIYVDPTGKSKLNLVTSFMHELAHVEQGTGLAHKVSAAATNASGLGRISVIPGYFLNPVEINAAASAFAYGNNLGILAINRLLLDGSNVIKYGSERDIFVGDFLSSQYNQWIDKLCQQLGYE